MFRKASISKSQKNSAKLYAQSIILTYTGTWGEIESGVCTHLEKLEQKRIELLLSSRQNDTQPLRWSVLQQIAYKRSLSSSLLPDRISDSS